jgi:SAM-dependent methyltransferase
MLSRLQQSAHLHPTICSLTTMATSPQPARCTINPLLRSSYPTQISCTPQDLRRVDEGPDAQWYAEPRFVQHIDDGAIAALKSYYGSIIGPNDGVLDICSSWVSHLPENLKLQSMVGVGMNQQELARNAHLTRFFVKDLNTTPNLKEISNESTDVVICNVSVDYLIHPVSIFEEMHRVLRPGGSAHMAFSNRCFPTKVIGKWMEMNDEERRKWVGGYFWASGEWAGVEEVMLKEEKRGIFGHEDPMYVVRARKAGR